MKTTFSIGDRVEHKLFGKGTIKDINGIFDGAKLTIEFEDNISKLILSKYVKLVKKEEK
tara:strand:+ start:243 stop:419 length:177 start_codon:yes stop_codon:yes gene_type:complete